MTISDKGSIILVGDKSMLDYELLQLIQQVQTLQSETSCIEVKAAEKGCPKFYDTLSSFSNQTNGGVIIFGLDAKNAFKVCGVYDAADLQKKIMEASLQMEPTVYPVLTGIVIEDKAVICAEIPEIDSSSKPCFYKGAGRIKGSYIRTAEGDRLMTEYEIYNYEAFKKSIHNDIRVPEHSELCQINQAKLGEYVLHLQNTKPNLAALTKQTICTLQGFVNQQGYATMTGIFLFSDYPQGCSPQLCIIAVVYDCDNEDLIGLNSNRFIDNARIDGTIPQMLNSAISFVRRNMSVKTFIDKNSGVRLDRYDYPIDVVRELILNALVHRDYSTKTESIPITIKMFKNFMKIENPGGLYGRMTIDNLGKSFGDTRNVYLATALESLGVLENRYSGIPTVLNSLRVNNYPAPIFTDYCGSFSVTLFKDNYIPKNQDFLTQSTNLF